MEKKAGADRGEGLGGTWRGLTQWVGDVTVVSIRKMRKRKKKTYCRTQTMPGASFGSTLKVVAYVDGA